MDSGRHLVLAADGRRVRAALALAVQVVFLLASCALLFLGAFLGAGVLVHALRDPHQHHPCGDGTRETCM
jgi:hypothetical protein